MKKKTRKQAVKKNRKKTIKTAGGQKLKHPVGVVAAGGRVSLFFRRPSPGRVGLYLAAGKTGLRFAGSKVKIKVVSESGKQENISQREHISVSPFDGGYFMTFVRKDERKDYLVGAISKDMKKFTVTGRITVAKKNGILAPNYKHDGQHVIYAGEGSIRTARSKNLKKWKVSDITCLTPRSNFFDHAPLSVLAVSLTEHGVLLVYDASYSKNGKQTLQVGGALFSLSDPDNLIWRSESPLWQENLPVGSAEIYSVGAAFFKGTIFLYFVSALKKLMAVSIPQPFPSVKAKNVFARLKKFHKNPIIIPDPTRDWSSEAVFNPAALYDDGKVHLLYRAVGKGGLSCFGYASTKDGFHIEENLSEPAYVPRKSFEGIHTKPAKRTDLFKSGCGWGGCEDPKLTAIDDKIYLTYVAYSGYSEPRVALSWIKRDNFLRKQWNWQEPILISRPGVVNKSGCILPEKVKGEFVIFHRVFPHILIDYRNDLEFSGGRWLEAKRMIATRPGMWDSRKISVGATPIRTKDGWLVIYHAIDDRDDTRYKIGAMILDPEDPSRVLYRTSNPILEPDEHYENEGKPGIAYPCGAVVLNKELFVYYGGGDRVVCCATVQLDRFIEDVKKDKHIGGYELKEVSYA